MSSQSVAVASVTPPVEVADRRALKSQHYLSVADRGLIPSPSPKVSSPLPTDIQCIYRALVSIFRCLEMHRCEIYNNML